MNDLADPKSSIQLLCLSPSKTIRETIACIDRNGLGIAMVVDEDTKLLITVTDGDIRRAMLAGMDLDSSITELMKLERHPDYRTPATAHMQTSPEALLQLMQDRMVRQLPLLDDDGRVVGLTTLDDLLPPSKSELQAVIMAGGLGTRLRPLTEEMPKPMLPLGGKPLLEHIINQLRDAGIQQVNVTTHYKSDKITDYFGDGRDFGVSLNYVKEELPLGTGGALGLLSAPSQPLLVVNGDILTQVNFKSMLAFHQEHRALMTVGVRRYEIQVPYGVVESDGVFVKRLREKPELGFFVNAGIYLLEPGVYKYIPSGNQFNMTDLIQWLLDAEQKVVSFPIREYWLDIGQHADYVRAQDDFQEGKMDSKKGGVE